MLKKPLMTAALIAGLAAATFSTQASAHDPVLGALIGGGIGAAVGGPPGAAIGAIIGLAAGADPYYHEPRYYDRGYSAPRYYDRGYYAPAPTYYAPAPVYYGPAVAYRSYPSYAYDYRYARGYDRREWRGDRRHWDDRRYR